MSIGVRCGSCGRSYQVSVLYAGRTGRCKTCGAKFDVPAASPAPEPEPELEEVSDAPPLARTAYVPPATPPPVAPAPVQAPAAKPAPAGLPWYFGFCRLCSGLSIIVGSLFAVAAFAQGVRDDEIDLPVVMPALGTALGMIFSGGFALAVLDGMAALVRRAKATD